MTSTNKTLTFFIIPIIIGIAAVSYFVIYPLQEPAMTESTEVDDLKKQIDAMQRQKASEEAETIAKMEKKVN